MEYALWDKGNGESIYIWTDPWVPNPAAGIFLIFGPKPLLLPTKVSQLFNSSSKNWNADLLAQLFSPTIATAISSIYVSPKRTSPTLT